MEEILVMMSTYNGEKYIREQIDSILHQKDVKVDIVVRDDGSKDNTQNILTNYSSKYKNIKWSQGDNVGPCKSFLELLYSSGEYEYYAFADQDDYWYPNKLKAAIEKMKSYTAIPCLYFGRKNIVDEERRALKVKDKRISKLTYGSSLVEGVAYGCTMVLNRSAVKLLKEYKPRKTSMHDVWAYRVISALGKVIYDDNPYIDYRQHKNNCVGAQKTVLTRIKIGIGSVTKRKNEHYRSEAAEEIYDAYADKMSKRNRNMTYDMMNVRTKFICRIKLILNPEITKQSLIETIFVKVFILLGWI